MECVGVVKDSPNSRFGLIFNPREYIAQISPNEQRAGAISKSRRPLSLSKLLQQSPQEPDLKPAPNPLDLSIRYNLAKQLVSSVFVLHAAGWVHKKYS